MNSFVTNNLPPAFGVPDRRDNDITTGTAPGSGPGYREAGIVEKLLPSYGFIQCCERQARLFFHYSQFNGNIEHLRLGDPVEFEMTYDRRTGKPIASSVIKITSEAFIAPEGDQPAQLSQGFITTEPLPGKDGRVAYENRGECFFLPFTLDDIEPGNCLRANDKVSFRIATDKSGHLRARKLTLLPSTPEKFTGIVCTLKDSFGFIERSDVVKEIFFHSSECPDFKSLNLGDHVEFGIQTRNDKKVAVNVRTLPSGTVVFEDVSIEKYTGVVLRLPDKVPHGYGRQQYSTAHSTPVVGGPVVGPLPGIIRFVPDTDPDVCFAIKDINGEFTLKENDLVVFHIVTDKRDNMKHAGRISLHDDCFVQTREPRDQGYIASLKDTYGFIKCLNQEGTRVYFKLTELLDPNYPVNINDEVEFTLLNDTSSPGRVQATRIKLIPNGTVMSNLLNPNRNRAILDYPLIDLDDSPTGQNSLKSPHFDSAGPAVRSDTWSDILSSLPIKIDSHSNCNGVTSHAIDLLSADDPSIVTSVPSRALEEPLIRNGVSAKSLSHGRGVIAALKELYGFIEHEDHQAEVFFHFSTYEGNPVDLELGHEVEFTFTTKNNRLSAENVRRIPSKSLAREDMTSEDVMSGVVLRACRCQNPDQEVYTGLIRVTHQNSSDGIANGDSPTEEKVVELSMMSLADIRDFVQKGDAVTLQLALCPLTGKERAVNVKPIRNTVKATVDAIKSNYGFLNYDVGDDGKKLFFHMSEFKGVSLSPGDTVEFAIVHNQRTNKYSACNLIKCNSSTPSQRPEHLISKIKLSGDDIAKVVVIRQPRGPDGTKGFPSRNQKAVA